MKTIPLVPLRLAEAKLAAGDVTPVMLFPLGEWKTNSPLYEARYPKGLPLTQDTADAAIANFDAGVLGGEVQFSLAGAHGVPAAAAFWVQRLYCAPYEWQGRSGDALWADAKWTQVGADAANDEQFKYVSVELGDLTTNDGAKVPWVLQGGVLTNYPLIKIMPPIASAGDAIAAADSERQAEFEIPLMQLAGDEDPVLGLLDDMDALAARVDAALKGKKGMPVFRTMLSQARARVSAHRIAAGGSVNELRESLEAAIGELLGERVWVCDFSESDQWVVYEVSALDEPSRNYKAPFSADDSGITLDQPVEVRRGPQTWVPVSDSSPSGAQATSSAAIAAGKATEGPGMRLARGDAARKGADHKMNAKTLHTLNLAEGADDVAIDAAVMALAAERDEEKTGREAAELKLSTSEKAQRTEKAGLRLAELIKTNRIKPGRKDELMKLAEDAPEAFEIACSALAETGEGSAIPAGEIGSGKRVEGGPQKRADVELAHLAKARQAKDGGTYAEAMSLELAENKGGIAERYNDFIEGREG